MYKVNVEVLEMLKNSDFAPTTSKALEDVLNLSREAQNLKGALAEFKTWCKELNNFADSDTKYGLADACYGIKYCYNYIKDFLVDAKVYSKLYNKLEELESFNTVHNFDKIIDTAMDLFCPNNLIPEFRLIEEIKQDDLTYCYKLFIKAHVQLAQWTIKLENDLYRLNEFSWSSKVFDGDSTALAKTELIQRVKYVLVSFCEDTTKLNGSTQNVISASLLNTANHKSFQDRSYGFMYKFDRENLLAMSFEDAGTSCMWADTLPKIHQLLIEGRPLISMIEGISASPIDLKPLYNLDKLLAKTEKYNEILLRPDSQPFGIFVWEDKLHKNIRIVCSLCTVYRIPLYIAKEDGSLRVIPWREVFVEV